MVSYGGFRAVSKAPSFASLASPAATRASASLPRTSLPPPSLLSFRAFVRSILHPPNLSSSTSPTTNLTPSYHPPPHLLPSLLSPHPLLPLLNHPLPFPPRNPQHLHTLIHKIHTLHLPHHPTHHSLPSIIFRIPARPGGHFEHSSPSFGDETFSRREDP